MLISQGNSNVDFFRKRNKNLADVLVQIESGTKVAQLGFFY